MSHVFIHLKSGVRTYIISEIGYSLISYDCGNERYLLSTVIVDSSRMGLLYLHCGILMHFEHPNVLKFLGITQFHGDPPNTFRFVYKWASILSVGFGQTRISGDIIRSVNEIRNICDNLFLPLFSISNINVLVSGKKYLLYDLGKEMFSSKLVYNGFLNVFSNDSFSLVEESVCIDINGIQQINDNNNKELLPQSIRILKNYFEGTVKTPTNDFNNYQDLLERLIKDKKSTSSIFEYILIKQSLYGSQSAIKNFGLYRMKQKGFSKEMFPFDAEQMIKNLADSGDSNAQFHYGLYLQNSNNTNDISYLMKAKEQDHICAKMLLCENLEEANEIYKYFNEYNSLFFSSPLFADDKILEKMKETPEGSYYYAKKLYKQGSFWKAKKYFLISQKTDKPLANYYIGKIMLLYTNEDPDNALKYLSKAYKQGIQKAKKLKEYYEAIKSIMPISSK